MAFKLLAFALVLTSALAFPSPKVDSTIWKNLEEKPLTNVLVQFKGANPAGARWRFQDLSPSTREERLTALYTTLKSHADDIQREVSQFLEQTRVEKGHLDPRQLWMSAELIIRNIDRETLTQLSTLTSVEFIQGEKIWPYESFTVEKIRADPINWNLETLRAASVWRLGYTGKGVVVANIDSGVRHTHESLRDNFRGAVDNSMDYAWYAPTGRSDTPTDEVGTGTHTMGIMAGNNASGVDIGIAPGATWIACRGCELGCSSFDLLECGNWIGCPTDTAGGNPDCSKAPHLVSNGWGGGQDDSFYDDILAAWRTAGIAAFFSSGNQGPTCGTATSPGDRIWAFTVTGTEENDLIYSRSSMGPARDGSQYPNVGAPASKIHSADGSGDNHYRTLSGSGKSAHAAGVAALLFQKSPNVGVEGLEEKLQLGAKHVGPSGLTCGGVPDSKYPNYQLGYGRIDALNSFYS